eukprot:15467641-Alexandrium_andersonii.AAC.1
MQHGFSSSELELRRPRNDLTTSPRTSRGVCSASFCALSPMVATRSAPDGGKARKARHVKLI